MRDAKLTMQQHEAPSRLVSWSRALRQVRQHTDSLKRVQRNRYATTGLASCTIIPHTLVRSLNGNIVHCIDPCKYVNCTHEAVHLQSRLQSQQGHKEQINMHCLLSQNHHVAALCAVHIFLKRSAHSPDSDGGLLPSSAPLYSCTPEVSGTVVSSLMLLSQTWWVLLQRCQCRHRSYRAAAESPGPTLMPLSILQHSSPHSVTHSLGNESG
jgi:hypothetical protein